MNVLLEVRHITKRFEGLVAVHDVSLEMHQRQIHALIGPNGAGKTTLLSMINGTLEATQGDIFFAGEKMTGLPAYRIAQKGMGRTYQNIKLFGGLSVLDNLMIGGIQKDRQRGVVHFLLHPRQSDQTERETRKKALDVANSLGLFAFKDEQAKNLPYGFQKILELGRALMAEPKLVLLDEPAAGLNPAERAQFVEILQKVYEQGVDLFLIEHNMDVVMNLSHQITVLNFGQKIAEGTAAEIQENPEVIRAYLGQRYQAIDGGKRG